MQCDPVRLSGSERSGCNRENDQQFPVHAFRSPSVLRAVHSLIRAGSENVPLIREIPLFHNEDLRALERFFLDVMSRRLAGEDTVNAIAFSFFGEQGPWYTVGWKMAVTIERRYGRAVLIQCMEDPRLLLYRYNEAAADYSRSHPDTLARWSPTLLGAIAGR